VARVLERAAEVDMRRAEGRVDQQTGAQRVDRARRVAEFAQRRRVVEIGEVDELVVVVIGDPQLVDVSRLLRETPLSETFGGVDEVGDRALPPLDAVGEIGQGDIRPGRRRRVGNRRCGRRGQGNALAKAALDARLPLRRFCEAELA
jgi:hypothetical protein